MRDRSRAVGALQVADDAVVVHTDNRPVEEVVAHIVALAVQRRPLHCEALVTDQLVVGRSRQAGYVRVVEGSINDPPMPWQLGLTKSRWRGRGRCRRANVCHVTVPCSGRAIAAWADGGAARQG